MITVHKHNAPKVKRNNGRTIYPFQALVVGGHFVVKCIDANENSIRACSVHWQSKLGRKFSVNKQPNGDVTVERTE